LSINAGKYRWPSKLYTKRTGGDWSGEDLNPRLLRELWVEIVPRSSSESTPTQGVEAVDTVLIRTPWTPEPIDSTMMIENERGWFDIEGIINKDDADMEFEITATKRPNDGKNA